MQLTLQQKCGSAGRRDVIRMDVCSDESVKAAIDYIIEREGGGIVVNNAGMGIAGSVETLLGEAYLQFVQFLQDAQGHKACTAHMRKRAEAS